MCYEAFEMLIVQFEEDMSNTEFFYEREVIDWLKVMCFTELHFMTLNGDLWIFV